MSDVSNTNMIANTTLNISLILSNFYQYAQSNFSINLLQMAIAPDNVCDWHRLSQYNNTYKKSFIFGIDLIWSWTENITVYS